MMVRGFMQHSRCPRPNKGTQHIDAARAPCNCFSTFLDVYREPSLRRFSDLRSAQVSRNDQREPHHLLLRLLTPPLIPLDISCLARLGFPVS